MGTRREFMKKAAYSAPVVLTMAARPSFASSGSDRPEHKPASHGHHGNHGQGKGAKRRRRRGNHDADW
ncbi:MAG: hypothetical protein ACREQZ_01010 [Woeseiaceae bacterium]